MTDQPASPVTSHQQTLADSLRACTGSVKVTVIDGEVTATSTARVIPENVRVGDRIHFHTRETGFAGDGLKEYTGTVTRVTAKTIRVDSGSGSGGSIIRFVDWNARCVRRASS